MWNSLIDSRSKVYVGVKLIGCLEISCGAIHVNFPKRISHSKSEPSLVFYSGRPDTNSRKQYSDKLYYQRGFCRAVCGLIQVTHGAVYWWSVGLQCLYIYTQSYLSWDTNKLCWLRSQTIWTCVIFGNPPLLWRCKWHVDSYFVRIITSWRNSEVRVSVYTRTVFTKDIVGGKYSDL